MTIVYEEWQRAISRDAAKAIATAWEPVAYPGMWVLGQLLDAAKATGRTDWPPIHADVDEDGDVTIEWIWPKRRILVCIGQLDDDTDTGWQFIDGACEPIRIERGTMETFDAATMVGWAIGGA